jgi:tetratricopeptide (TPR) repeat protein
MIKKLAIILIIIFTIKLNGQIQVIPEGESAFIQATKIERSGNIEDAEKIYKRILLNQPSHQPSYFQLKNIYKKNGDSKSGIILIETWLINNPNDHQSQLALGEFYFRNQQQDKAIEIWTDFRETKLINKTMFRLLFHTYVKFGQTESMESIALEGREKFNEPHFLSIDLASYYQSRQTFDRALNELMILMLYQKQYIRYATDRILIMSDDEESHSLIDSTLNANLEINPLLREVLAGFYYKTAQFSKSFDQYQLIAKNNKNNEWINFAENLRKEKQYELSIRAYHMMLEDLNTSDPKLIGKILLGLGKSYEDQIIRSKSKLKFVKWFPENNFFNNQFIQSPDIDNDPLANSLEHYQSVLALLPNSNSTARVHYRLAQMQSRIMRDYEGAKSSFETALKINPSNELKNLIYFDIGNLLIFSGKYEEAANYFKPELGEKVSNRTIGYINSLLYDVKMDSVIAYLDSTILTIDPNHKYFNDLFEIHDVIVNYYIDGTRDDKEAFKLFFIAESLINEYKIQNAVDLLEKIRIDFSDALITPLVTLRLAFISVDLNEYEKSIQYALAMENTLLKDWGLALAGEVEENFLGSSENALKYYYRLLSECSTSLLSEPIRIHVRKISQPTES